MKTYHTEHALELNDFYASLKNILPARFNDKIKGSAPLYVKENRGVIEIGLPLPYEEYLYKIELSGNDVSVSKSEHYTDDVNSLALEDILTEVIIDVIGK